VSRGSQPKSKAHSWGPSADGAAASLLGRALAPWPLPPARQQCRDGKWMKKSSVTCWRWQCNVQHHITVADAFTVICIGQWQGAGL
jgi:hypothetical protein